jgi:hypothetical protein
MTLNADESIFPSLFAHTLRQDWGVGVCSGEKDGKRSYLFENGEERTLAAGFHELMRRVEEPSAGQQVALARLRGMLAGRARDADGSKAKPLGWSLANQLAKFRESYPSGVSDPDWIELVRGGDGGSQGNRQAMLRDAKEKFDVKALDSMLSAQQHAEIWEAVASLLGRGGLVPAAQLKLKPASPDSLRKLAVAVRELLHGNLDYAKRLDRFVSVFTGAFGVAPGWELATALSALVHPLDHVCIEPAVFKKQLKVSSVKRAVSTRPTGSSYASFLSIARLVANKLAEQGEIPRDLWDVRDFMAFTLKPSPKGKSAKKTVAPPSDEE